MSNHEDFAGSAGPCASVVLTHLETVFILGLMDSLAGAFEGLEDQTILQTARDKLFLSMDEDFRAFIPGESPDAQA